MTELEKIEYAKSFIDKLANGINPLDDSPIPDGDICNQVRLSRCFFYVSDLLRRVVEQGGITPPAPPSEPIPTPVSAAALRHRIPRMPFSLAPEAVSSFSFSDRPIGITELTKRINALVDTDVVRPLHYRSIVTWLMSVGMLEGANGRYGASTRCPSAEGERIGISIEQREGPNGAYFTVCYNAEAQAFILDHISAIAEV